jgi:hypothetical protein
MDKRYKIYYFAMGMVVGVGLGTALGLMLFGNS